MSVIVNLNGVPYLLPETGESGWGQNVTSFLQAVAGGGLLQLEGGNFTLLSDVNFGPNFGLVSPYFKSDKSNISTSGALRLANTDTIGWRNGANNGNLLLSVSGDLLTFNGTIISNPLTTKGDVYTYSTAPARLGVGSNGQALVADSSTPTGLKWASVGGSGGGSVLGFTFTDANGISGVVTDPTTTPNLTLSLGAITPTSVVASGTITASNISGVNYGDQYINVKRYGAVGDGSTDDTTALQNAINAASTANTCIYLPPGSYKITATLDNTSAANFRGIIGEDSRTSTIVGGTLTSDALNFLNIPAGFRLENFGVTGPGQSAVVTSTGIKLRVTGGNIVYHASLRNLYVSDFPVDCVYLQVPVVSILDNVVGQLAGRYCFFVDELNPGVGGTSTTFNNCYANNSLQKGFYIKSHVYSSFNSCAADNCNDSYYFYQCSAQSMQGCGSEVATYISGALPGRAVVYDSCTSMFNSGQWTYFMPNIASVQFELIDSSAITIVSSAIVPDGILMTNDIKLNGGCSFNSIINALSLGKTDDNAVVSNSGANTLIQNGNKSASIVTGDFTATGSVTLPALSIPYITLTSGDINGNSIIAAGNIVTFAAVNDASFEIFQNADNFPRWGVTNTNTGTMSWSSGSAASDVFLDRTAVGELTLTGNLAVSGTVSCASMPGLNLTNDLVITTATNPQIYLSNTGISQDWAISADNGGGVTYYDATNAQAPMYLWPVNGTPGENGLLQLAKGLRITAGGLFNVEAGANSASGTFTLVAGTATVSNTLVTNNTYIYVFVQIPGGTQGFLSVGARTAGVSFTINSTSATETSYCAYLLVEP